MTALAVRLESRRRPAQRALTVLDVTEWYGDTSGGIRTYLQHKGDYVIRQPGLRQVLVTPGAHDAVADVGTVRRYQLRGPRVPMQSQYRFLLSLRALRQIIRLEQPDVIEVGSQLLTPWLARLATPERRVPLVVFYHANLERLLIGSDRRAPWSPLLRASLRSYMRRMDAIFDARIAASDSLERDLLVAGIRHVTRIPLGVDLDVFHPDRAAAAPAMRAALGVPPGSKLVVYAGRLAREKGLPVLLDAWRAVEAASDAWLVLVGEGPLAPMLRERAAGHSIRVLPFQSDRQSLAELLATATATVAPGSAETFGLAPLESMASGTPVVTADRGAVAELVARSGGGITFRSGSPSSLAAAIRELLGADHVALGALGRRHAEREHGWDVVFDRLFDLYRGLAHR